jgi:hypothetical protein
VPTFNHIRNVEAEPMICKIFANEVPLGHIHPADFIDLVVQQNVRPEWPDDEDAPQLSDAIWGLAENCWVKVPKDRPTASAVCDILCHLLDTAVIAQPTASPSSHLIAQASPPHPLSPAPNLTL